MITNTESRKGELFNNYSHSVSRKLLNCSGTVVLSKKVKSLGFGFLLCLWVILQVQVLSISLLEVCKCIIHCPIPEIIISIMPFGENYKHSLRGCNSILQEVKSLVVTEYFLISFLCTHCSHGRCLFTKCISAVFCIFHWASSNGWGFFHIWSTASGNQILCSLNQFIQNFPISNQYFGILQSLKDRWR